MTPLQQKILNLRTFYCQYEYDPVNKCKNQCSECKALEESFQKDFND